ncbi:hypothetical protein F2Q69_00038596 [Brassica cretica]|uniref:RNase H type-1 domain-containing protein n=1 Tax=Brassica cretica TaxID=69181 RepID=A0A8S9SJJ1_BRACR|nr:hypothetical protein F2Q69_00038596 [Brassica cretica]
MEFSKSKGLAGGAWVLRNERGVVLSHSRRAFSRIENREEAKFVVAMWALESLRSQSQSKKIFPGELGNLFGAVERPQAWPLVSIPGCANGKGTSGEGLFSLLKVSSTVLRNEGNKEDWGGVWSNDVQEWKPLY